MPELFFLDGKLLRKKNRSRNSLLRSEGRIKLPGARELLFFHFRKVCRKLDAIFFDTEVPSSGRILVVKAEVRVDFER